MLTEHRSAARLLTDRSLITLWLGRLTEQIGGWLFLLALLVAAWDRGSDISLVAWTLAAFLLPRLVVVGLLGGTRRLSPLAVPYVVAARAAVAIAVGLATVIAFGGDVMLILAAGAMGSLAAVAGETRVFVLRSALTLTRIGPGAVADAVVDRGGLLLGSLAAAAALTLTSPPITMFAGAAALGLAAALTFAQTHQSGVVVPAEKQGAETSDPRDFARRIAIYLVGAFTAGALAGVLLIVSLPLATAQPGWSAAVAPILVAAVGLGMLIGPLPVPRLLLRVPAHLLLLSTSFVTAALAFAIAVSGSALVAIGLLPLLGFAAMTQSSLCSIAIRRLVPADLYQRMARMLHLALTTGQLYGAVGVVSVASSGDPLAVVVLLAISQVILVVVGVAFGGRDALQIAGLSSLPIKSVVHKLSWETRPAAVAADFAERDPRARRLAKWINRQVSVERLEVTLPISKRVYEVYRPDEASRERLLELGRADPEKQMPYWAKVWPSGVALADVVVERKLEVADTHVLELGAGLGVTAAAVLEYGGHIVTADYSALPLAHCRLNALVNTGRPPRTTCFNWRHEDEVTAATAQPKFRDGFPLIIAADVLYEGRDAEPLLNVIEQLLVADGSLWLAEPVRRTAQRFLDSAAGLGWEIDSRQVQADWPDATSGPVNLHFLTRSPELDRIVADLGGWRI